MRLSFFKAPPHLWLWLAILSQFVLTAILIQIAAIQESFGIVMPSFSMIKVFLVFGLVVFISMEIIKAILRTKLSRELKVSD